MNSDQFSELSAKILSTALGIQTAKRPDYTIESLDVLQNFKAVGERLKISPLLVGRVYALKHEDAITRMAVSPLATLSEPPLGRICDRINYALLEAALLLEVRGSLD